VQNKLAIVTTTINVPHFLEDYCKDFKLHNRSDVRFIIIGDKKTPTEAESYCLSLGEQYGYEVEYYNVPRQVSYLSGFPELDAYLPYNSVQRRNIGMVRAYELGSHSILTVDDDNYLLEADLLKDHLMVGEERSLRSFHSSAGWFDPCQFLCAKPNIHYFHRGFPMSERSNSQGIVTESSRTGTVVTNVGMWLGDPDVDAFVRMTLPLEAVQWTQEENFTLAPGTWAPFNSQQTTIARELLPAYFLNPHAGRYDDIWGSFIIHRLAEHFGDMVAYGHPIVNHLQKRSLNSLWRDLDDERMGLLLTDEFVKMLRSVQFTAESYAVAYIQLADALDEKINAHAGLKESQSEFLREFVRGMRMWTTTLQRVGSSVEDRNFRMVTAVAS
jgi:Reversibly glycosylated polypeptide